MRGVQGGLSVAVCVVLLVGIARADLQTQDPQAHVSYAEFIKLDFSAWFNACLLGG